MKYSTIRGMDDILPDKSKLWQNLEEKARKSFSLYGYNEIRTPIVENTEVFVRGIGKETDIVSKQMYTFNDRKGRSLSLRPEGTAPVVRSFVQHGLERNSSENRLYYMGPMFRSERPQKGRLRQFHQIGAELIGPDSVYADAEIITQLNDMLHSFGLKEFKLFINSLGCTKDKEKYSKALKEYFKGYEKDLCEDCNRRVSKNVLRVLDCKNTDCKKVIEKCPDILNYHCDECKDHFDSLKGLLDQMDVKYIVSKTLVRGLDYYQKTVFELTHTGLGSQDAIGAGGRYNNLVKDLGGRGTAAVGYAIGIERVMFALKDVKAVKEPVIYVASLGDKAKSVGAKLARDIRDELDICVLTDLKGASLKSQFRSADKAEASYVVVLGDNEIENGIVVLRDMKTKEQHQLPMDMVLDELGTLLKIKG